MLGSFKHLLFLLLLANGWLASHAQVIDVRGCDSTTRFPITNQSAYLQTLVPVTIDSVLRSTQFITAANKPVLVFNYDPYYYWFRFIIRNQQDTDRNLMLVMAPTGLFDGQLFQKTDNRWQSVAHTGLRYRFGQRSYQFTHYVFPFTIPRHRIDTFYVSIDGSNAYKSFGFALLQPRELKVFENKLYLIFGIIVGLLLLFFILNISLFFALREKLHLWYAFYIALLFLVVMKNDHLDQEFLGWDSEQAFRLTPYMAIGALAITVLLHVVQGFLKPVLVQNQFLYRFSTCLKINALLSAGAHAFVFMAVTDYRIHSLIFTWAKGSTLLGICIIIVDCAYCIKRGFKGALFLLGGTLVFMLGSVQRLYFPSTLSFLFPPTTFHLGIIVETFVVSLGLIYRYWWEKNEQQEREMRIQRETLNKVSLEIHDNIGQTLTVANLNLKTLYLEDKEGCEQKLNATKSLISTAITDLRSLSRTLKNESESVENIVELIKKECLRLEKTGYCSLLFSVKGEVASVNQEKQNNIIRIVKEALGNIINHSQASRVAVSVAFTPQLLTVEIEDNGIGFDAALQNPNSNGLNNIRSRCHTLNAICRIESQPGAGTRILVEVPAWDQSFADVNLAVGATPKKGKQAEYE